MQDLKDKAEEKVEHLEHSLHKSGSKAYEKMHDMKDKVEDKLHESGSKTYERMQHIKEQVGQGLHNAGEKALHKVEEAAKAAIHSVEDKLYETGTNAIHKFKSTVEEKVDSFLHGKPQDEVKERIIEHDKLKEENVKIKEEYDTLKEENDRILEEQPTLNFYDTELEMDHTNPFHRLIEKNNLMMNKFKCSQKKKKKTQNRVTGYSKTANL